MRLSFDLDDTLILHGLECPVEPNQVPFFLRPILRESIRRGAVKLVRKLEGMGVEICVYTTSGRSLWYIRSLLGFYGIRPVIIVNQAVHERVVGNLTSHGRAPSKIPRLFGIDLHVDDSRGVAIEGERFNFEVLVVDPGDEQWAERVVEAAAQVIKKIRHPVIDD